MSEEKTFILNTKYGKEKVKIITNRYMYPTTEGGIQIALACWENDGSYWTPYCTVSTNLPETSLMDLQPVDRHAIFIRNDTHWYPGVEDILADNKIAKRTTRVAHSGYCTYDEWIVDLEQLKKYVD